MMFEWMCQDGECRNRDIEQGQILRRQSTHFELSVAQETGERMREEIEVLLTQAKKFSLVG